MQHRLFALPSSTLVRVAIELERSTAGWLCLRLRGRFGGTGTTHAEPPPRIPDSRAPSRGSEPRLGVGERHSRSKALLSRLRRHAYASGLECFHDIHRRAGPSDLSHTIRIMVRPTARRHTVRSHYHEAFAVLLTNDRDGYVRAAISLATYSPR